MASQSPLVLVAGRFRRLLAADSLAVVTKTAGDNTTDAASTAFVTASFAKIASPTFTGTPAAPTAAVGTNTTQLATTAFALAAAATATMNLQVGTTYTLVLADAGKMVDCSNAGAITLTVPLNSSVAFPVGTMIGIAQGGAGAVTVAPAAGVTLKKRNTLVTAGQEAVCYLQKVATDTWRFWGDST